MYKIILIGMKSSGKTTISHVLANNLGIACIDLDAEIEKTHTRTTHEQVGFRDIFKLHGQSYFRSLEAATLVYLASTLANRSFLLATGGGTPLDAHNQHLLHNLGTVVFLDIDAEILLPRIVAGGIPAFFPYPDDPAASLQTLLETRRPIYRQTAHITIACYDDSPEMIANSIMEEIDKIEQKEEHDAY